MNFIKAIMTTGFIFTSAWSLHSSDQAQPFDFGNRRLIESLSATTYNIASSNPEVIEVLLGKLTPHVSPTFNMGIIDINQMLGSGLRQAFAVLLGYKKIRDFFEKNGFTADDFVPPTDPTQNEGNASLRIFVSQKRINESLTETIITFILVSNTRPHSLGFIMRPLEEVFAENAIALARATLFPYNLALPRFDFVDSSKLTTARVKLAAECVKNLKYKKGACA